MLDQIEKQLSNKPWNLDEYGKRFDEKINKIIEVGIKAAKQYKDTYRQAGKAMRFADVYRKYKRVEGEMLYGNPREREKLEDDLLDLAVYTIVLWIYNDEYEEVKEDNRPVTETETIITGGRPLEFDLHKKYAAPESIEKRIQEINNEIEKEG